VREVGPGLGHAAHSDVLRHGIRPRPAICGRRTTSGGSAFRLSRSSRTARQQPLVRMRCAWPCTVSTARAHLDLPWAVGPPGVVLVLDGLFLHRDELHDLWELSVFLDVPFDVTAARMAAREGSNPDPHHPSMRRYVEAQRTYFKSCRPAKRADLVIDNSDWDRPALQADR